MIAKTAHNNSMYFNYHAKIKRLIAEGHFVKFEFLEKYNNIAPALLLYFDNEKPMPIREHKFAEYLTLIENLKKD